ncbi:MAG: sigma-70 family RNA polymerase sigma factor [Gammaproteobacteria bacterium]
MHAYQDMVFSTAARLTGNDAQAEDLAQETFLKAYESFDTLRDSPAVGGWLKTVVTNLTLNHLSRYRNRWRMFSDLRKAGDSDDEADFNFVDVLMGGTAPDQQFAGIDTEERRRLVEKSLQRLPEHQRVPLVLYHFEDMPYQDIARQLRVSLPKVKTDIMRARLALVKILAAAGFARESVEP